MRRMRRKLGGKRRSNHVEAGESYKGLKRDEEGRGDKDGGNVYLNPKRERKSMLRELKIDKEGRHCPAEAKEKAHQPERVTESNRKATKSDGQERRKRILHGRTKRDIERRVGGRFCLGRETGREKGGRERNTVVYILELPKLFATGSSR